MKPKYVLKQVKHLVCGFMVGVGFSILGYYYSIGLIEGKGGESFKPKNINSTNSLATNLFAEVRLLCWIMTTPENHKTKAIHVENTWGRKCNKLLFMSTQLDVELGTVALPVKEGRNTLFALFGTKLEKRSSTFISITSTMRTGF